MQNPQQQEQENDPLETYCRNLTKDAEEGALDAVIGREAETRRCMQILMRRTKNNPILLASPGVGKTALVEKLAQRIVSGDVPETLKGCQIYSLDMGALVAGTSYRGEFEKRLKGIVERVEKANGQIILFIDEIHLLSGAGKTDGAMDAANLIKPSLARGKLRCIGATTPDEYRQYIEKDSALERRFQKVTLNEPSVEDTISILRGLRSRFETHHGIDVLDASLVAAAKLSDRYIQDRFQPDKSIDLLDESLASLRVALDSRPEKIDQLERRKTQLTIEEISLKKEKSPKLKEVQEEIKTIENELKPLMEQYEREKGRVVEIADMKKKIEQVKTKMERAQREGRLDVVSDLKFYALPDLRARLVKLEAEQRKIDEEAAGQDGERLVKHIVTPKVVAGVVSRWTGIPVARLLSTEAQRLLSLEADMNKIVIGQERAVKSVANAIVRARAGLSDANRPTGTFIFFGPSGCGKTLLAKTLASMMFDSTKESFLRLDMSEYKEEHSVAKLLGAPPGYVGFERAGTLTEHLRRRPFSLVLFDELEKASPRVSDILLQLFDDGRLTDSHGRTCDARNAVFICTSNLGSDALLAAQGIADDQARRKAGRRGVFAAARQFFRPEFLNRVDEMVVFEPLSTGAVHDIIRLELQEVQKRLNEREISIEVTDNAVDYIGVVSFSPLYGARPLKRWIDKNITTRLSTMLLSSELTDHSTVTIDAVADDAAS
eukprot:CAMPEP_0168603252 /NCGR_PEP_ID=MMETSP0420-20121227/14621_1 /TAXON_ID=498008 /ORGANISM="Pessonella sp." /LENGTH=718 /DNA_ID=CAMNT_0008642203 /DNA_START=109 /DNA_END=2265 /DNA_ORIENTATION=+